MTAPIETAVHTHINCWNAGDRDKWLSAWHPDVIFQDPVGSKEKNGIVAIENTWDKAFQAGHSWNLEPVFMSVCGDQVAVHYINHGNLDGNIFDLESIEIYWIGDCGRIVRCHTYFNPSEDQVLDPWFTPGWNEED